MKAIVKWVRRKMVENINEFISELIRLPISIISLYISKSNAEFL